MTKGFTCGAFDLLHAGHIVMLKENKRKLRLSIVHFTNRPKYR